MPKRNHVVRSLILLVSLAFAPAAEAKPKAMLPDASSSLSDYVAQPDSSYAWRVRQRGKQGAGDYAELILTSQTWHDIVWKHQLFIYRPAKVRESTQELAPDRRWKLVRFARKSARRIEADAASRPCSPDHDARRHDAIAGRRSAASAQSTDLRRPQGRPDHRLDVREVFRNGPGRLAAAAADGQVGDPRNGRRAGILQARIEDAYRAIPRYGCIQARLDHVAHRSLRPPGKRAGADGHQHAQYGRTRPVAVEVVWKTLRTNPRLHRARSA